MRRTLLAAIILATALAANGAPAFAEDVVQETAESWALTPARDDGPDGRGAFDYTVEAGDVYSDQVAVRNVGSTPITVELHAFDAVQTTESDFSLLEQGETGPISSWVQLEQDVVTVEPRSFVVVPFRFAVPSDAEPGDHAGGIVATSVIGEGSADNVQFRVGSRMHLRVAGPVAPALRIDSVTAEAPWTLLPFAQLDMPVGATLVNTGNVRLAPTVRVEVSGLFGWWRSAVEVEGTAELLPGGAQRIAAAVADVPQLGPLWVTVSTPSVTSLGQDLTEFTEMKSQTIVVWATPWVLVCFVLVMAGAVVMITRNLMRRRASQGKQWDREREVLSSSQ